jgi:dihydrofolate synthase/folylpolyglutamate synthase
LGETLQEVAAEKAGIIKENTPIVIGETQDEVQSIFIHKANNLNANIYFADVSIHKTFSCSLRGNYQKKNIKTAIQTLELLKGNGFDISDENIQMGLISIQKNTGLRGRWEVLSETPKIICDTAHNKEGLSLVLDQLQKQSFKTLHIVLGMVSDKSVENVVSLFPKNAKYYFCKPNISRGLEAEILSNFFTSKGYKGQIYFSVNEAFDSAKHQASSDDLIFVGGSTFVVAEVL